METTPKSIGTSLEVLAPYLPYEIEVEVIYEQGFAPKGERYPLLGIDTTDDFPVQCGEMQFKLPGILPVLKPFSALTTPLPDRTVPAVEVAKLVMAANRPESRTPIASYCAPVLQQGGEVVSVECRRDTSYALELLIDSTWAVCTVYDFGIVYAHNAGSILDYLRSKHFAVGLDASQFISAAASPTLEKGTAS